MDRHPVNPTPSPGSHPREKRVIGPADRAALSIMLGLAGVFLAIAVGGALVSLKQKLVDGLYTVTLPLAANTTDVPFPDLGTADVVRATQSNDVFVTVSGLSGGLVSIIVLQHVLGLLIAVSIAGAFIFLCIRLLRAQPFLRSMTTALGVTAILVLVLGTGSEFLGNLVTRLITGEITGGSMATPVGGGWTVTFTGVWVAVSVALAAVATAFQIGERLQRDTDGLV